NGSAGPRQRFVHARRAAGVGTLLLFSIAACRGQEPDSSRSRGGDGGSTASGAAPMALASNSGADSGATLTAMPIPAGTLGIGVAYDPSQAGMTSVARGVSLAVRNLNARGGNVRFVARTSTPGVTSAVQSATELRDDPGVIGVVGHSESGSSLDAIPVYEDVEHEGEHAVVAVSPTATSPRLT